MQTQQNIIFEPIRDNRVHPLSPDPEPVSQQSFLESNVKQIKSIVCRYYTLFRIAVLLPLSVISRIASVYFLVNIALSSTESFDAWWKLLSLIGYVFYFTVGSVLFFMIAPSLEIEVGRKEKSHGYFGGIIGELKGLVFRNRYHLHQTYLYFSSEQPVNNLNNEMRPEGRIENTVQDMMMNSFDFQASRKKQYRIQILNESSIQKGDKHSRLQLTIYEMQRKLAKFQQNQRQKQQNQQNQQLLQMKNNLNSTSEQYDKQLQKLHIFQKLKQQNDQRRQRQRQQQLKRQKLRQRYNIKDQERKLQLDSFLNQIRQILANLQQYSIDSQFEQKILKECLNLASFHKLEQKYGRQEVIKQLMAKQINFLVNQFNFRKSPSQDKDSVLYSGQIKFFYKILLREVIQFRLLAGQINLFPQNEKQLLLSHMILKKELKQLNAIQVKEKKFYLFLFNLLNATDAMIAWYDYYQLPDVEKFQKFESSYYFLILCFEQIPQIIAQGFSLNYVEDNEINITIFAISLLKLTVCTILKLYNAFIVQNTETQTQKQHKQHQDRIKKFQQYHAIYKVKSQNPILSQNYIIQTCIGLLIISSIFLPLVNRILLYIYLRKVMKQDPLVFWVSMICLGYYFIVGNSLAILAYNVSREDRKKYRDKIFTCTPEHLIKWVISLIIVILNTLNSVINPIVFFGFSYYLKEKDKTFLITFTKFFYKSVYIYLAFEGIPFTIIYSMALARSQSFGDLYRFQILVLVFTVVNIIGSIFWVRFVKYTIKDARDEVLEVVM